RLQTDTLDELDDALRLRDVARERLLAGEALQLAPAALDRVDDLLDVLDTAVVRAGEPDRLDRRVRDHVGDRCVRLRLSDIELARGRRGSFCVRCRRAPEAEHIAAAHALPRAQVEVSVEATANEPHTQGTAVHRLSHSS